MYTITINKYHLKKILKCDSETFSVIKIKDDIQIKFNDLSHFNSCRNKLNVAILDEKMKKD